MEMSIDEAIYCMECKYYEARNNNTCASSEGHQVAIEIMRKYQKIKEQVDIAIDKENFAISGARLIQIREIINGNND